jgi:hypothetical protein
VRFRHRQKYDASPAEVLAMLGDPAFREQVCRAQHAHKSEVTIKPDGAGMSVVVDQTRPSDGIPGFARKIVGDEIRIVQREEWADASRARLDVTIPGKPGELKGHIKLAGHGAGSVETIDGELGVSIPLLGAKLEGLISGMLTEALEAEHRVGVAWLAGAR